MSFCRTIPALAGFAFVVLVAAPSAAHHALTMYDLKRTITLEGTVKAFQWTNPHSWITLVVMDKDAGGEVEWSIEAGSPNGLSRNGWTAGSLKPGDRAFVDVHPQRDVGGRGLMVSVTVGGRQIGAIRH